MWRTLFVAVFCAVASAFSYHITVAEKKTNSNLDSQGESAKPDFKVEEIEIADIYYHNLNANVAVSYSRGLVNDAQGRRAVEQDLPGEEPAIQPWSILWYIGSFGGLIAFFLIVSWSEWCCRNRARRDNSRHLACAAPALSETPPPAYDLFAPPSYDTLGAGEEKGNLEVFVVPVRDGPEGSPGGCAESPPLYQDVSGDVVLGVTAAQRDRCKEQREIATQT